MNAQITSNDLQKKIRGYLETLVLETDLARQSDEMRKYLDFVARFHQYSPSNIFLIMLTRPDATHVAGFQAWKKMNRWVKAGEHGIPIFAPIIYKEDSDEEDSTKVLYGFRVVFVFDISQTDGDPLPPVPDWKSPEKSAELTEKLIRFAESKGITVTLKDLPGETQGVSKGGKIEISPNAGTKTLIHEIAHELMHRIEGVTKRKEIIEWEAESVAYIVAKYFDVHLLNSPNYLILHGFDHEIFLNSWMGVCTIANQIIQQIED
jgi:hypothetical protein